MTTTDAIRLGSGCVGLGSTLSQLANARLKPESFPTATPAGFSNIVPCETMWCSLTVEEAMHPDRAEFLWDAAKSEWMIRIETGEEVIRRHCDAPKHADDQTPRSTAQKTVEDERSELDLTFINIGR